MTEEETSAETQTAVPESLIELETDTMGIIVSENMESMPEIIEESYDVVEIEPAEVLIWAATR